ncbi:MULTISPECIES: alpha/beta hydrolase [unclassified Rhizobium]|uniref:alpha/beta hydrolase n=1 Tax=unclassified Rhizobium TaxID=2613769 RepID=UPI0038277DB4
MSRLDKEMFHSLSLLGMVMGLIFFAASLTPSLMPRSYLVQGALSGVSAGVGYMIGTALTWLWFYLQLPTPDKSLKPLRWTIGLACLVLCLAALWHATFWQNSIRLLWKMPAIASAEPYWLAAVAAATFLAALVIGRLFRLACLVFSNWLSRMVPSRLSKVVGALLAIALFWSIGQGILLRLALDAADASFQQADALIEVDQPSPQDATKTGSYASLVEWQGLGRQGRHFVASGPTASEISSFWNMKSREPLRVYVGLNNAETSKERAALALKELIRQGAFDRSLLVVIVPTGTGWIDPAAMDTLEYLERGDVASVAVQYSYLTSWMSLLFEPREGEETAVDLFDAVYGYWSTLPRDKRPKLYLHGLSLGALNSQLSLDIYNVIGDPVNGALWSGPPFRSARWMAATAARNPGTPEWLPKFRDGSVIRFANQEHPPEQYAAPWGPLRVIYLQYASDPVVFFDASSAFREPGWMKAPRGPDVSPQLTWIPVVTMLQLLFDMMIATTSPVGYGHIYAPQHYIDSWISLTDASIAPQDVTRLKSLFASRFGMTP